MENVITNLPVQYGSLGLLILALITAIVVLWRQLVKERDDYFEQSVQTTAALVELNVLIRDRK